MTSWVWLAVSIWSDSPISGSAGSMESMAMALVAISPAMKATNSRKPMPG